MQRWTDDDAEFVNERKRWAAGSLAVSANKPRGQWHRGWNVIEPAAASRIGDVPTPPPESARRVDYFARARWFSKLMDERRRLAETRQPLDSDSDSYSYTDTYTYYSSSSSDGE